MRKLITLLPITLLLVTYFVLPLNISAQDTGLTLGHTPSAEYLTLEAGDVYEDKFTVWNLGSTPQQYYLYVSGFEQVEDFPGTATPLSPEDDRNDPYSASSWFALSEEPIVLEPQINVDIPYTIRVPSNAALGEYYTKIFLSTDNPGEIQEGQESSAFQNLGSGPNFLIKIGSDEDLNELAEITKFSSDKSFYSSTPVVFSTEISNLGNTHVKPEGEIIITNFLNQEIDRINFNEPDASILRGNTGTYESTWTASREILTEEGVLAIGPIKADLLATYKTVNPGFAPLSATTSFWIIPWKLLLAILGAILLLIIVIVVIAKRRKKNKKGSPAE